jgi:hypothetical protein
MGTNSVQLTLKHENQNRVHHGRHVVNPGDGSSIVGAVGDQSKHSRNANEYEQTALMGMFYAVMCSSTVPFKQRKPEPTPRRQYHCCKSKRRL